MSALSSVSAASAIALTEQMHSLFSEIKDSRVQRTRAHLLVDILIIGILSVIAGGKGWEDMETYGLSKLSLVETVFSPTQWHTLPGYL